MEFPILEACLPAYSFVDIDTIMPVCTAVFDTFQPLSCDVLASIIHRLNRTTCGLDPFPTKLLMSHLSPSINIILRIMNLCFLSGDFPASCKSAIISTFPVKSKLMCFNSVSSDKPYLTLCGKPVDVVDNDLHLGNRIYNNIYTQCSNSMISDFYRRSNQVKASFRMCDSFTLSNLHSTICNSFYGIELYNFNKAPLKNVYTA